MKSAYQWSVAAIVLAAFIWGIASISPTTEISDQELAERVRTSRPDWADYREDLKAQLGATPVARWEGELVQAWVDDTRILLAFELSGTWAAYDFGLPMLLRDHLGSVQQNSAITHDGSRATYEFLARGWSQENPAPWIEVMYPNQQRRLVLSSEGTWANTTVLSN